LLFHNSLEFFDCPRKKDGLSELMNEKVLPNETLISQTKYLFNIVEQDEPVKKITKPMFGFRTFLTTEQTLKGIETMHMIRKGQPQCLHYSILNQRVRL
jgi:IS6 family transposase